MRQQSVVYVASGENSGTYSPLCFLENFSGDLNETCERFISWDFNMLTTVPKYKVFNVWIPEWMDERKYLNDFISLKYAVGLAGECVYGFSERVFNRFVSLNERQKYVYGWLRERNKPSAFYKSILQQFDAWLTADEQRHGSPLSPAQWEAVMRFIPMWKAKQISSSLYNNRYL